MKGSRYGIRGRIWAGLGLGIRLNDKLGATNAQAQANKGVAGKYLALYVIKITPLRTCPSQSEGTLH